jgi:hypothetical protein
METHTMRTPISLLAAAAISLSMAGVAEAATYVGTVGPDRTITLTRRGATKAFQGDVTWTVKITTGARYRYFCATHTKEMHGSFRVG